MKHLNSSVSSFKSSFEDPIRYFSFLSLFIFSLCFFFVTIIMTKMMLRSSPAKDHKKDSPLKSQGIIEDSAKERCSFSEPQIDRIRHYFLASTVFKTFDPTVLSDFVSETWVAFPVTPFMIGYSYPFPDFTQSFFSLTGISYIQAMPMMWRVLYTLERIIEHEGIDLGMSELAEMYNLLSNGSHRYLFKHKPGEEHPIFKTTKNDTKWKRRFFFVRRDSIPDGKDLPRRWVTHAITVSHIIPSPVTKERLAAFRKLDPAIRSFQANIQDSQEVSSGSVTMSSKYPNLCIIKRLNKNEIRILICFGFVGAGKSSKSATRFSVTDLTAVGPRSGRKKTAASPSTALPKPVTSKGKKRKASETEDLDGLSLIRHQFLEYFSEKFAEIQMWYDAHVEEAEQKHLEFHKIFLAKDQTISSLKKELNQAKKQVVSTQINADYEKHEIMEDAKVSAAITMYKIKLQMAQEAEDPDFDRSTWDKEGWKAKLAELEDEEVLAIEASGSGKDQAGGGAGGCFGQKSHKDNATKLFVNEE
ncbi:hypothetical protein HanPSC8_Chr16g0705161 [Helianthus annuus]|nr:hypothetical protein HanPSC8_Chr16g0705161 [Helianthus annuus]